MNEKKEYTEKIFEDIKHIDEFGTWGTFIKSEYPIKWDDRYHCLIRE